MSLGEEVRASGAVPEVNGRLFELRPDFCRFEVSSYPPGGRQIYKDYRPLFTRDPDVRKLCSDSAV
jgi:hypothetical protein